ncbi:hypothetical protein AB1L88_15630 [Tautonia sp. JC769]|uniref:hypothetical protein n=1 Tax=Tautonia sp. JC769 TaxID=3232135 RepID=UPI003459161A
MTTETTESTEANTFAAWLRDQVDQYEDLAASYESAIPAYRRMGHTDRMIRGIERQAWLSRRIASLCRELADEAQATRSTTPDELDDARARFWEQEQVDRSVPGEDPSPCEFLADYASQDQNYPRPHPMAAMGPGRRPSPCPDRPGVDDEIDIPF